MLRFSGSLCAECCVLWFLCGIVHHTEFHFCHAGESDVHVFFSSKLSCRVVVRLKHCRQSWEVRCAELKSNKFSSCFLILWIKHGLLFLFKALCLFTKLQYLGIYKTYNIHKTASVAKYSNNSGEIFKPFQSLLCPWVDPL